MIASITDSITEMGFFTPWLYAVAKAESGVPELKIPREYPTSVKSFKCLVPSPKHIIIDMDEKGKITDKLYAKEQTAQSMLKILGYN